MDEFWPSIKEFCDELASLLVPSRSTSAGDRNIFVWGSNEMRHDISECLLDLSSMGTLSQVSSKT